MSARHLARRLWPPVLLDLLRGRPPVPAPCFIWEGIYAHLRDVPSHLGTWDFADRGKDCVEEVHAFHASMAAGILNVDQNDAMELLASTVAAERGEVRVLDFGGGVGMAFLKLTATLRVAARVRYSVVDLEGMCEAGRSLFKGDDRIDFHTSIPPLAGQLDIVYSSSALQYVDDYPGTLRKLAALHAKHVLLTFLPAGPFKTYAARQLNMEGQVIPHWFLNVGEVVDLVCSGGYTSVYDGRYGPDYDQSNYPESHRLGRHRELLFVRTDQVLDGPGTRA
jgi:putative methyltransferase (TIGR04325 family)